MKIDIFNHIIPQKYFDKMVGVSPRGMGIQKRVREIPAMVDLDERFRAMDLFQDYVQVICLANPPIEALGPPPVSGIWPNSPTTPWPNMSENTRIISPALLLPCR